MENTMNPGQKPKTAEELSEKDLMQTAGGSLSEKELAKVSGGVGGGVAGESQDKTHKND
jgi:bacteriocin-like protein